MANTKVLRHIVLLKFKDSATPTDVTRVEDEFRTLARMKIAAVKEYEWGTNVSKENLDRGYTHCFILTFANEQDRDAYLVHKDHQAFVDLLKPFLAEPTVIDFWTHS